MVALRSGNLVQVQVDADLVVMGMLVDRRDELRPCQDADGQPANPAGIRQSGSARENAALVDGRILAQMESLDLKISRAEDLIERLGQIARDVSIRRLHEGRLRNLRSRREAIADTLMPKKELSLSVTPVAVGLVSSTHA